MKKLFAMFVCGVAALSLAAPPAMALPFFKEQFDAKYTATGSADLKAAVDEAKCNVCHYGTKKTNRNSYGVALSKLLKKDDFKASRIKDEKPAAAKEVADALTKVESEKDTDGKTFGEKLKAGKLPGTVPADAK